MHVPVREERKPLPIRRRLLNSKYVITSYSIHYTKLYDRTILMKNKFPFVIINISLNSALVDVNVHPAKTEVRFSDEQFVFRSIYHAVKNAITGNSLIPSVEQKESFIYKDRLYSKKDFEQRVIEQTVSTPIENMSHRITSYNVCYTKLLRSI